MMGKINPLSSATKQWFPEFNPLSWHDATRGIDPSNYGDLAVAYVQLHWRIHRNYHDCFEGLRIKPDNYDAICDNAAHHAKRGFDLSFAINPTETPKPEMLFWLYTGWFTTNTLHHEKHDRVLNVMDYQGYLRTKHWKTVRYAMLILFGSRCMKCRTTDMWTNLGNLHLHHVTYERRGAEVWTDLMLLCADCHKAEHANGYPKGWDLYEDADR